VQELRWFAVNTQPNAEPRAQVNLERQGWTCFCPRMARTVRSGRRLMTRLRPLFPGYIFVHLDPSTSRWRTVDSTFGVRGIVKSGDMPAPLPIGVVETLREMADQRSKVSFASALTTGETVQFVSGPLTGLMGKLEQLDATGRITVLLELLGRETPIRGFASEVMPTYSA
jgi:transcription elongation factor/antiterminator RfaH